MPLIAATVGNLKSAIVTEKRLQYKIMAELGNEEYFSAEGVLRLKEENEALQNNLELAGELGKSLLENNQELERKLEEVNSEHISSLEKIEVVISYSEVKKKKWTSEYPATFLFLYQETHNTDWYSYAS